LAAVGYNAQNLGRFVVSEEFDFDWRTIPAASCVLNCEFKSQMAVTLRACGLCVRSLLPYVTGGRSATSFKSVTPAFRHREQRWHEWP
jgi:hypothetical protein